MQEGLEDSQIYPSVRRRHRHLSTPQIVKLNALSWEIVTGNVDPFMRRHMKSSPMLTSSIV